LGRISCFTYDDADNRTSETNPPGETTTYIWDTCLLSALINPLNQRSTYTYDRFANRVTEKDALGNVTSYGFDNVGFLTSITNALGKISSISYNNARQKTADI